MSAPKADIIALAVVGAAGLCGKSPAEVFGEGKANRAVRALAAASLARAGWGTHRALAGVLAVHAPECAPSLLARAGVPSEHVAVLASRLPAGPVAAKPEPKVRPKHPPRVLPAPPEPQSAAPVSAEPIMATRALGRPRHLGPIFKGVVRALDQDGGGCRRITIRLRSGLRVRTFVHRELAGRLKVGQRAELIYVGFDWLITPAERV